MPQLNFYHDYPAQIRFANQVSNGTLSFCPFTPFDSISLNTLNLILGLGSGGNQTYTLNLGLYSLTGSTLSLANSVSATVSSSTGAGFYQSFTATSATQNITPGTWWWGILGFTGGQNSLSINGGFSDNPANAFPGAFVAGRMTASTAALPASIATSDLDITGSDAIFRPYILISA